MLTAVRVQEKGQVTIPSEIRRKLRLKKGDLVTFIVTSDGVIIQSVERLILELQKSLEICLQTRQVTWDALYERSRQVGGETACREVGLNDEERGLFYQVVQLRAQQALEEARTIAASTGLGQMSDKEIETEIQTARAEARK